YSTRRRARGELAAGKAGRTDRSSGGTPIRVIGPRGLGDSCSLPIALWLAVGIAYAGGRWRQVAGGIDFIRFAGKLFIYSMLIALGCGVLTGFVAMLFEAISIEPEPFLES
ncbi:MAG: hypothetical protein ACREM1_11160, partial [Longimicrobiales bacterium]